MMLRKTLLTLAAATCASLMLVACGEEEAPAVVQAPPPPPKAAEPPPPPKVPSIRELMAQLDIDPRVNLPEERAPETEAERVAVLKFFDAFVRGNADGLRGMLSAPDQFLLDEMVKTGDFSKATGATTRIDVRCGREEGHTCTLAVFHVGEGFEPQLWQYNATGSTPEFDAVACPPGIMDKLSGDNWIAAWYTVLKLELAKADEPDEMPEMPKQDFTENPGEGGEASPAPSGDESAPNKPGGMPGRRMPGAPIKAPKPPGFGTK